MAIEFKISFPPHCATLHQHPTFKTFLYRDARLSSDLGGGESIHLPRRQYLHSRPRTGSPTPQDDIFNPFPVGIDQVALTCPTEDEVT
jgi:hypothetical protein